MARVYRVVRVPDGAYKGALMLKARAVESRVRLPQEVLSPKTCPVCGGRLEGVETEVRVGYKSCSSCGYVQPVLRVERIQFDFADLGKGLLFAFGIACLAYLINKALKENEMKQSPNE